MESCGPYQIVRELGARQDATVYLAREGAQEVALVVFATALEADPAAATARAEAIIDLQEKAAARSAAVAPVLKKGVSEGNVWYSTRFYPRVLLKLLQGRVALSRDWIHQILARVVDGTLALKRTSGRSHGDLKLTNILLGASNNIKEAEVVITEPASDGSDPTALELADLKAIGLVLYQLARRREAPEGSQWLILPIESSPEWTQVFGRDTEAWLGLCNTLLDPNLTLDRCSLESLQGKLLELQPKPPVSKRALAIAAGLVVAGLIAGAFAMRSLNRGYIEVASNVPATRVTVSSQGKVIEQATVQGQSVRVKVPKGRYQVSGEFKDLDKATQDVSVEARKTAKVDLKLQFGTLIVISVPPGAAFELPDGTKGTAPFTNNYTKPGPVKLQLNLADHDTTDVQGTVRVTEPLRLEATLLQRKAGDELVEFTSSPSGATVSEADGRFTLSTRGRRYLPPGTYSVVAQYQNWPALRSNIVVRSGTNVVNFSFPHGTAVFSCVPESTEIFADPGTNRLATANQTALLPAGPIRLRFQAPGYETNFLTTNIVDQGTFRIPMTLDPILGFVRMMSDPPGAIVYDAANREIARPTNQPIVLPLPPASYNFTAKYEGLAPVTLPAAVERAKTNILNFAFKYGRVQLSSDPAGAEVLNPMKGSWERVEAVTLLPEGPHPLTARQLVHGLSNISSSLTVTSAHKTQPLVHKFLFDYGSLVLTSAPPDLDVRSKGQFVGRTPWTNPIVPFGALSYQIAAKNRTNDVTVNIASRGWTVYGVNLEAYVNSIGMELVWVEAGKFWVSKHEVTQGDYMKVLNVPNPSQFTNSLRNPVENVSAQSALAFCAALTALDQKGGRLPPNARGYTLPSDVQWFMYVADARLEDSITSYKAAAARTRPEEVGSTGKANLLGLFDVRGNVWEWCLVAGGTNAVPKGGSFADRLDGGKLATLSTNYSAGAAALSSSVPRTGFRVILESGAPTTAQR